MKEAKMRIDRYRKHVNIVKIVTVLIVLTVLAMTISLPLKIVIVIAALWLEVFTLSRLMTRTVNRLMEKELDPALYYAVAHGIGVAAKNGMVDITAAYYMYDYRTAYNLCLQKTEQCRSEFFRYWYTVYLARMYFDTWEIDKLRAVCKEFQAAFVKNRRLSAHYGALITFYSMFCDGDFKGCCDLYRKRMEEVAYKRNMLVKVQMDYAYAVSCYRNGDLHEATTYFERIVQTAPKLNFAHIAKKYLDAMESGSELAFAQTCVREESFTPPTVSRSKPPLSKWIITGVVLCLSFLVIGVSLYQSRPQEPLAALQAYDDDVQGILTILSVNEKGDALCVYQNINDQLGVAYLDAKSENRYQCKITSDGTEVGWYYTVEASDSDLKMTYVISETEQDIPQTSVAHTSFSLDKKTYYFVVATIEQCDCLGYSVYVNDPAQIQEALKGYLQQAS